MSAADPGLAELAAGLRPFHKPDSDSYVLEFDTREAREEYRQQLLSRGVLCALSPIPARARARWQKFIVGGSSLGFNPWLGLLLAISGLANIPFKQPLGGLVGYDWTVPAAGKEAILATLLVETKTPLALEVLAGYASWGVKSWAGMWAKTPRQVLDRLDLGDGRSRRLVRPGGRRDAAFRPVRARPLQDDAARILLGVAEDKTAELFLERSAAVGPVKAAMRRYLVLPAADKTHILGDYYTFEPARGSPVALGLIYPQDAAPYVDSRLVPGAVAALSPGANISH